ncbi:MAG: hypothetical protein AAB438_02275 [Patescibacteria group bacterium]
MMYKNLKKNKGYSSIELIFYIALFSAITLVVINSMIVMVKAFQATTVNTELIQGSSVMERISREIRSSYGISSISATDLVLNTKDIVTDNNKTVQFRQNGNNIELFEDGVSTGYLNIPNLIVSGLSFTQITTTEGLGIKIFFTVASNRYGSTRTEDFYNTVVLRGSY